MKLAEAKLALRGYLDQLAVLRAIEASGEQLPWEWRRNAEAQVRAMVREVEKCQNLEGG